MTPTQPLLACDEHTPTPARLQQTAASQLSGLYGDADYMATPERWDAAALLARAARFAHPRLLDGSFNGWLDRWEEGERVPLATIDTVDHHDTNKLARAVLAVHGHLTAPTLTTGHGLDLACGDTLIIGWDEHDIAGVGHAGVLDTGMLADVAAIHTDTGDDPPSFTLDIPVAGVRVDVDAASPLAAKLTYAYAEFDGTALQPPAARARGYDIDLFPESDVDLDVA